MVQEYVSPIRVHKFPFEMVMAAYERRFPSCPQIPVVVECVITDDSWTTDNSQRHTTRRCQLNVEAPYLLKKMIGVDYIYFIQKNHLDLKSRVLEIEATNETFSNRVCVVEKCRYYVHPENPEWTCFEQSALLDVLNFFGLESTVEKIAMKQYAANIAKGKELIESFMAEVHADGVRELSAWSEDDPGYNKHLRKIVSRGKEPLSPKAPLEPRSQAQPGTSSSQTSRRKLTKPNLSPKPSRKKPLSSSPTPIKDLKSVMEMPHSKKSSKENISKQRSHSAEAKKQVDETWSGRIEHEPLEKSSSFSVVKCGIDAKTLERRLREIRPCACPSLSQAEDVTRWEGLISFVVIVMLILWILTSPFTYSRRSTSR